MRFNSFDDLFVKRESLACHDDAEDEDGVTVDFCQDVEQLR